MVNIIFSIHFIFLNVHYSLLLVEHIEGIKTKHKVSFEIT